MTRYTLSALSAAALAFALCGPVSAQSPASSLYSEAAVQRFDGNSIVQDSYSQLLRGNGVIAMELATSDLVPNAPYTTWWVIFNTPKGCSEACGADDIFNPDGTINLNPAAAISIVFADGAMTDDEGNVSFSAILPVGRALGEVVAGPGLIDSRRAEVHLVVRAHGPLDLNRAYEQLSTFEPHPTIGGTCVLCQDVQFAVHQR